MVCPLKRSLIQNRCGVFLETGCALLARLLAEPEPLNLWEDTACIFLHGSGMCRGKNSASDNTDVSCSHFTGQSLSFFMSEEDRQGPYLVGLRREMEDVLRAWGPLWALQKVCLPVPPLSLILALGSQVTLDPVLSESNSSTVAIDPNPTTSLSPFTFNLQPSVSPCITFMSFILSLPTWTTVL